MMINCIIIDDEPLARKGISNFVKKIPSLTLLGEFEDPMMALPILNDQKIDLIFLDISMPKINGLEFLKSLPDPPLTIITTAFGHHALESYELNVIDYLVKPIPLERFLKAVNKASDYIQLKRKPSPVVTAEDDYFFVKCDGKYEKIILDELLFVEGMQNYVVLHTPEKRYTTYLTFKGIEEYLPPALFLKVSKSYIVALSKIDSLDSSAVKIGKHMIPISRSKRNEITSQVLRNKVVKR